MSGKNWAGFLNLFNRNHVIFFLMQVTSKRTGEKKWNFYILSKFNISDWMECIESFVLLAHFHERVETANTDIHRKMHFVASKFTFVAYEKNLCAQFDCSFFVVHDNVMAKTAVSRVEKITIFCVWRCSLTEN